VLQFEVDGGKDITEPVAGDGQGDLHRRQTSSP
jgi:hypothetical protein